jgi:hypothetical protein
VAAVVRVLAPIVPRKDPPKDPIFIVGSPRSGTTMLFTVLSRSRELGHLGGESHLLWEMFHAEGHGSWESHAIAPEAITPNERRALYWAIDRIAGGRRYLDKAPRNSLNIPYLHALFPGAWFVYLKRDGRAVVSSLLTGWRTPNAFPGRPVEGPISIDGYGGATWKFLLPPGWRDYLTGRSLAEVCAFQWVASNEAILSGRDLVPPERWVETTYEEFVRTPRATTSFLLERLKLHPDGDVLGAADDLDRHVTRAITPPAQDKWRTAHPEEVASILPAIEPTMHRLGYLTE